MLDRLHAIFFFGLLSIWGGLTFILPEQKESKIEGRLLKNMPRFSWQNYVSTGFTDSLDGYLSDHFPLRDPFVSLSFWLKDMRGIKSDELGVFSGNIDMDAGIDEMQADSSEESVDENLFFNDGNAAEVGQLNHKILIYKGRAIQMFGGENTTKYGKSTAFNASVANEIYDSLYKTTRVFVAITPSSGELLLPSQYKEGKRSERSNIDSIYKYLKPQVKGVDICTELHRHKNEYLYFATDHHWTGLGAYYGYVAWAKQAGVVPVPLNQLDRGCIHGFLGSLYRTTRDERLAQNPDSVEYFKVRVKHKSFELTGKQYEKSEEKRLYAEMATGEHSYGVFLSSDYPLMCVETNVNNGKVAVVIKNSYGNPFATYLASHFERIFIIDYRKFKCNLIDFCRKHKVTDLIICQGAFAANTSSHIEMVRKMIHAPQKAVVFPRDPNLFVGQ